MARIEGAFSLRWKILAWFFVNLAVLGAGLFLFLRAQFHVGINSLLSGPTDGRLEAIARPLAADLRQQPVGEWNAVLDSAVAQWRAKGVRAALYRNDGDFLAGDFRTLPAEVRQQLGQREHRPPGMPPGGRDPRRREGHGPPGPHGGPPPDDFNEFASHGPGADTSGRQPTFPPDGGPRPPPAARASSAPFEKFMLVTSSPRLYWAGVALGEPFEQSPGGPPLRVTLLLVSDSLRGGGLFFEYLPWLALVGSLLLVSVLMWLPFVHGLTRALQRMTHTAEEIAQGRFEPPPANPRRDELGRLNRALGYMAARLDGFVTGQKRFLGDTAHELLSPLARLEVVLSILEHQASPASGKRYAEKALDEVRHISALVHDLLSFTKAGLHPQMAELQPVALAALVQEAVAREAAQDHVGIQVADSLQVNAEPDLLVRAVANGVRNAVRYADGTGPITITAAPGREADGAEVVVLTVADHGPGVPTEAIGRLFDPFFRPETARTRETGGVGLGLAIVKSCVEACGGRVSVRNREPTGLELTFTLTRAEDSTP